MGELNYRDYDFHYKDRSRWRNSRFRHDCESQGDLINVMMQRELTKQTNLRARLKDLGFTVEEIERCFVDAGEDSNDDTVTLPWSVVYRAFNSTDGFAMGVQS